MIASELTPQERLTMPVVEAGYCFLDWFRSVVLGGQSMLNLQMKNCQSSQREFFTASTTVYRFGVLGGTHIIHQSMELNVKNCYQYLMMEYGTL